MHIDDIYEGNTLKVNDLKGKERTVVIASVESKIFDNGKKLVVHFQHIPKPLVCNKTNANRIASAYGKDTDGWIGKEIILYPDLVDFKGDTVEAIRVRPMGKRPPAQQVVADKVPEPTRGPAPATPAGNDMNDEIPW